jgi:hypothetical protein
MDEIIKWLVGILPIPAIVVLLVIVASAWLIKTYNDWVNYRYVLRHGGFIGTICLGIVVLSVYYRELFHNIALILIPTSLIAILLVYYYKVGHFRSRSGLAFANIILSKDNRYWKEGLEKRQSYPFAIPASQFFCLAEIVAGADPTFSVTIRNTSTRNVLLKRIGIEIICTAHDYAPQGRAGDVPKAIEITAEHDYVVAMPNLHPKDSDPDRDPFFPENPPMNIGRLVEIGSRSILLPAESLYAYTLTLANYDHNTPSKALIRMWVQTDWGEERSSPIYLTWGIF